MLPLVEMPIQRHTPLGHRLRIRLLAPDLCSEVPSHDRSRGRPCNRIHDVREPQVTHCDQIVVLELGGVSLRAVTAILFVKLFQQKPLENVFDAVQDLERDTNGVGERGKKTQR